MAKHHREDAAGLGAAAEHHREDVAGRSGVADAADTGSWRNSWRKQPAAANRQWPFDRASANCQFGKSSTRCQFGRVGPVVILADAFVKRSGREKGIIKKAASQRVSKLAA